MDLEIKLVAWHKIYKSRDFLYKLNTIYDEIFIDTPTLLNFYALSVLIACHRCIIPFSCDVFSRDALLELLKNIREVQNDHNSQLTIEAIAINQFSAQAKLPQKIVDELKTEGLPMLEPFISSSVKIRESQSHQKPLVFDAPKHKVSQQFMALYSKISSETSKVAQAIEPVII